MNPVEGALEEFGAPWQYNGWFFRCPDDAPSYAVIMDEATTEGSDGGALLMHRHSTYVELYDGGGDAAEADRARLSRILDARNLKHTRHAAVYLKETKRAMTVYDLEDWIEREGTEN